MNQIEPQKTVKFKSPESSFDLKKIVQYFLMAVGLFTCLCTAFFVFIIILIASLSNDQADKKPTSTISEQFPLQ
jgi:hypothetical protein